MVDDFVLLETEKHCAAGVDVDDLSEVDFFDADHHDGLTGIDPVLKHYLIFQSMFFFQVVQDGVVERFVVLDGFQVVDVETGDLFVAGYFTDVLVVLFYFLSDFYSFDGHFCEFFEAGVVFVQSTPKLEVDQS